MPSFAKWLKKLTSVFEEKTPIQPDHFETEHFLLYHGLAGTSPENQRQFKDVRADIGLAIDNQSSRQLAGVLKLPPLFWQDRLNTIFSELPDRELSIRLLAPDVKDDAMTFEDVPLLHSDWQVRSNAAHILSHLDAIEAIDKLKFALDDTARSARQAFCYQAYAIGKLGNALDCEEVLSKYLTDEEPWIVIDAAGALAELTQNEPSPNLLKALLRKHQLPDYAAVAVTRAIKPAEFLNRDDDLSIAAGCQLIVGLLLAAGQTFSNDTVIDAEANETIERLAELIEEKPSCRVARAAIKLAHWLEINHSYTLLSPPSSEHVEKVLAFSTSTQCAEMIDKGLENMLKTGLDEDPLRLNESLSAIEQAGRYGKDSTIELLIKAFEQRIFVDETIAALTELKASDAADLLIAHAHELVDLEDRLDKTKQLHPVYEEDRNSARTYWLILKALGSMPTPKSIEFLLKASGDRSPDQRGQALESLISAGSALEKESLEERKKALAGKVSEALCDLSPEVRKIALKGVVVFDLVDDLKKVAALTRAREVSVSKEAFETLSEVAKKGHKKEVLETIAQSLKTETDVHKRQKLKDFIDTCERQVSANKS